VTVKPSPTAHGHAAAHGVHLGHTETEGLTGSEGCRMLPRRVGGSEVTSPARVPRHVPQAAEQVRGIRQ
jgi:hypothetical protein